MNPAAENQAVYKQIDSQKVAKFNAPVFLENKQKIGAIDEIFGPINEVVRSLLASVSYQSYNRIFSHLC